jgi:hypothetical protein
MNLLRIGKRVRTPGIALTKAGYVIRNRWAAFEQNWEDLQRQLDQYLKVTNSIRQPSRGR